MAISNNPENYSMLLGKANILAGMGRHKEALEAIDGAIALHSQVSSHFSPQPQPLPPLTFNLILKRLSPLSHSSSSHPPPWLMLLLPSCTISSPLHMTRATHNPCVSKGAATVHREVAIGDRDQGIRDGA